MYNYIGKRKSNCAKQTISGDILGTESKISQNYGIDWVSVYDDVKPSFNNMFDLECQSLSIKNFNHLNNISYELSNGPQ